MKYDRKNVFYKNNYSEYSVFELIDMDDGNGYFKKFLAEDSAMKREGLFD